MKKVLFFVVAMALLVPGMVWAEVLTHAGAQVEITVPDKWKQASDEDSLTITSPDDAMAVVFTVLDSNEADKAFDAIDKELEKALGEIKWQNDGKPSEEKINGMTAWEWNGSAKEGKMFVDCLSIDTPADKTLGVYWFTAAEFEKKYEADVETIVKGLKPVAAPAPVAPAPAAASGEGEE
jgi:predicted Zn-dependent protease